jgi:hypothetical protein
MTSFPKLMDPHMFRQEPGGGNNWSGSIQSWKVEDPVRTFLWKSVVAVMEDRCRHGSFTMSLDCTVGCMKCHVINSSHHKSKKSPHNHGKKMPFKRENHRPDAMQSQENNTMQATVV